jgi:DUF4097 and DUF4098 domain-containing protein YvlB
MRRTLHTTLVIAALAGAGAPVAAQVHHESRLPGVVAHAQQQRDRERENRGQEREEQTERTTRTLRIGTNGELDLANVAGDIVVSRGPGQEATLEIVKTARAQSAEDARALLGLVQVDVVERGNRAQVHARYPDGNELRTRGRRHVNISVAYNVTVPAGTRVTARSVSGSVSTRDVRGDLSLESVSGNVTIANGGRVTSAKAVSGNVEIAGTDTDGDLDASSVSGSVAMRQSKARRLTLGTVSGNLTLEDVDCSRIDLNTVSGDVQFTGALSAGGRYDVTSHSGNVRVTLSGDTGFALDATSFSGEIRSALPLTGGSGTGERGRRQHAVRGVHGDGSAALDLTTFSGSIVITRR